ncbi:MAG: hypothetical protein JOZ37_20225, partial [Actinobacteria bacterium]|nr:hypothetical protein [Actinomycetota bacterium]
PPDLSLTLLIIVVIGGVTSLPGAILGTIYVGILKYSDINDGLTLLATGFGALLLLYVVPGGLAQIFYGTRDSLLRIVAQRRKIVVPSLLADVREEVTQKEGDVLADAAAAVEGAGRVLIPDRDEVEEARLRCPECGEELSLDEVADHAHFQVVDA